MEFNIQRDNQDPKILSNRKVGILATNGFDGTQLFSSKKALENAGALVLIISHEYGEIVSWDIDHWGNSLQVDTIIEKSSSEDFDALIIPGGIMEPENLWHSKNTINFIKNFVDDGKLVASICDGTKILISSGLTKGRTLTTKLSLKKDLINSGANWKDQEIVAYKGIISSRCPHENSTFNQKIIEAVSISPHTRKETFAS